MTAVLAPAAARALPWPLVPAGAAAPLRSHKRKRSDAYDAAAEPPTLVLSELLRSVFSAEMAELKVESISCVCIACKAHFTASTHDADLCSACAGRAETVAALAEEGRVVCTPEVSRHMEMVPRPRKGIKIFRQILFQRTLEPPKARSEVSSRPATVPGGVTAAAGLPRDATSRQNLLL